ncbi:hypothetical protein FDC49_18060 [Clostridium sporogenes]|uniref:hypothetical protein n=1 Tax=Clostridium sporogenes TaxID=1509 RepID=UPI0013D7D004|nr:hypothetical protein [Clostridium sporogenes]NFH34360.1 hypothetical protein [Clostridium sporogenes]NFL21610.1 hypothetical protein [Clostridium sporogenes]NFN73462.1 hypothetical protein [Clostridium sporogenes]NFV23081.1 hypothetical protein [Clostridium sporogenes]
MDKTIMILIKFAEKYEYVKMAQEGKLYMNSIGCYKKIEEEVKYLRKDESEGICRNYQPNKNKLIINNMIIDPEHIEGSIKVSKNKDLKKHIYCMYSLYYQNDSISHKDLIIDKKVKEFGEWFLLINDVSEFLQRVSKKLKTLNVDFKGKLVEYKDLNKYNGKVDLFTKNANYAYQKEYRIVLDCYNEDPYILDIGDISDISKIGQTKDIFNMIKIEEKI